MRSLLLALLILFAVLGASIPAVAADHVSKGEIAAKKVKKRCKKGQVRKKGKCVKRKKAKTPGKPTAPKAVAPDPLSDADSDGLPYKWEAAAAKAVPPKAKRKAAKRCKKGRVRRKGKCVRRKRKKGSKGKARRAGASAVAPAPASLHALGANPNRKDVFVEIDFASAALRQSSACAQFDAVYDAFARAPVSNPDGSKGITLHLDAGKVCPSRSYDLGASKTFAASPCPSANEVMNALRLSESRIGAFHLSGFAPTCGGTGEGGVAQQPGITSVVFTEGTGFAMPFMHELGHNLGLGHGALPIPNRISVMNGRLYTSATGNGTDGEVVDYQRYSLPALDENALDESAGIGVPPAAQRFYVAHHCDSGGSRSAWLGYGGAIDWNCNSPEIPLPPFTPNIDPGTVAADIDGDGVKGVLPATGNEWLQLDYDAGGRIGD